MYWYGRSTAAAYDAEIDLDLGMTFTLHTSGYALNRWTDGYVSDLTSEVPNGLGYTTGGVAAGVVSRTLTTANAWTLQRANLGVYATGDVVRPATGNGFLYRAIVGGVAGATVPTWPTTIGMSVTDGTVTWVCYASAIVVFRAANTPTWAAALWTGARYLVLSDRSASTAATQPLLAVEDFGSDLAGAGSGGSFTVNQHPYLGLIHHVLH